MFVVTQGVHRRGKSRTTAMSCREKILLVRWSTDARRRRLKGCDSPELVRSVEPPLSGRHRLSRRQQRCLRVAVVMREVFRKLEEKRPLQTQVCPDAR